MNRLIRKDFCYHPCLRPDFKTSNKMSINFLTRLDKRNMKKIGRFLFDFILVFNNKRPPDNKGIFMKSLKSLSVKLSAFVLTSAFVGYGFDGRAEQRQASFALTFKALEQGDIKTFRKQVSSLLEKGSFEEFVLLMESADTSGQTLFHGFAKAKKNKKETEEELKNLLRLLSFPLEEKSQPKTHTLAGVKIPPSKRLEEEGIAKAIKGGSFQDISNEMENLVKKNSAARVFSVLHGTTSSGRTLYGLIMERLENSYDSEEELTEVKEKIRKEARELRDRLKDLPFQEDNQGLTPLDTAEESNNKRVYEVLHDGKGRFKPSARRSSLKRGGGFFSAALVAWWITGFSVSELFTVAVAGTFGVFVGEKCYDSLKSRFSGKKTGDKQPVLRPRACFFSTERFIKGK